MFQVHLWIGILLALYVVLISISGCVLIFGNEITDDTPSVPERRDAGRPLPLESLVATAQRLYPGYRVDRLGDGGSAVKPVEVALEHEIKAGATTKVLRRRIFLDRYTGVVIADKEGDFEKSHPVYDFILDLHINLLAGNPGMRINAVCGGGLLLLCITGIIIWWPGIRVWKQALAIRWRSGWKRINFDAHRAIGFWTLLMVSMWAISGVYFGYGGAIRQAIAVFLPFAKGHPPITTNWKPGDSVLPVSQLFAKAQTAFPSEAMSGMILPNRQGDSVRVFFVPNRAPRSLHLELVFLNPSTGALVHRHDGWSDAKTGDLLISTLIMLHFASFQSLLVRSIFAVFGISPAILTITGVLMYWNRSLSKKWQRLKLFRDRRSQLAHFRYDSIGVVKTK